MPELAAVNIKSILLDDVWLGLRNEEALEPDLPVIDTHHHFIHWPDHIYGLAQYLNDVRNSNVEASVHVEAHTGYRENGPDMMKPVGETEFVVRATAASPARCKVAAAIVGAADLTLGHAVEDVLAAHIEAGRGRFRGLRVQANWDADIILGTPKPRGYLLDRHFQDGAARLAAMGLHLECFILQPQIPDVTSLARAFPHLKIVLNHVGSPLGIGPYAVDRQLVFEQWRRDMTVLAQCENVFVKLGGLGMRVCGFFETRPAQPPSSEDLVKRWGPHLETAIALFGPKRAMFESNYPIDKETAPYNVIWNCFKRLTRNYSPEERAWLFKNTASELYRID